jgi:hypothetical protein
MSSTDLSVPPEYRLVTEDRRRKRVRLTPFAILSGCVVLGLAVAFIVYGVRQIVLASTPLQPIQASTPTVAAVAGQDATATPEALPAPVSEPGCPTNRAQWHLVPYTLPGSDTALYEIAPPCVMEQVEQAFVEYMNARIERGRNWTAEDDARFFTRATFTAIVSGDEIAPPPPGTWQTVCSEAVKEDGQPLTSDDYHVVFHTVSEDGLVANLLVILGGFPTIQRTYDCATGELLREERQPGDVLVLYQPMVYDPLAGRWQQGWRYDVYEQVPAGQIDPQATVRMVLAAQGRDAQ